MKKILPCILCLSCVTMNLMVLQCAADLKRGYSLLQRGHRLEKRLITNLGGISFLDCVEECLRTTRCLSVNYFQPAHFCEVSFESKDSVPRLFLTKTGWFYSERIDWDKVRLQDNAYYNLENWLSMVYLKNSLHYIMIHVNYRISIFFF